mgnify:CR=1 FL=1
MVFPDMRADSPALVAMLHTLVTRCCATLQSHRASAMSVFPLPVIRVASTSHSAFVHARNGVRSDTGAALAVRVAAVLKLVRPSLHRHLSKVCGWVVCGGMYLPRPMSQ